MKIVIDVNLSPSWVDVLQAHSIEAVHWTSVGDARATDKEIIEWAREKEYAVFTHDLDFTTILALERARAAPLAVKRPRALLLECRSRDGRRHR